MVTIMWNGKGLKTAEDLFHAALGCTTRKEASQLTRAVVKAGINKKTFLSNLGYFAGYYTQKELDHMVQVFRTKHPYFGKVLPGPEEAFNMGAELGKKWKRQEEKKRKAVA